MSCHTPPAQASHFIRAECNPEEFCIDRIHGPSPNYFKAHCVSHENILRLVQASNSVAQTYARAGLGMGQLGVKWGSDALGGDVYVRVKTEL